MSQSRRRRAKRPRKAGARVLSAAALFALLVGGAPPRLLAQDTDSGASAYKTKCVVCHAPDGSGNTPVGKSLKAADLRTPQVQKRSDAELAEFISIGKGNMPSFQNSTPPAQIDAIVKYIRGFAAKKTSKKSDTAN